MNKTILAIAVIVVVLIGGYFLLQGNFIIPNYSPAKVSPGLPPANQTPGQIPDVKQSSPPPAPSSIATTPAVPKAGQTITVAIKNFAFSPNQINIKVGDTVKWTNKDSATHQIKSNTFNSDPLNTGASYVFKFTQKGTYDYSCAIHPSMTGKIIVE